MANAEYQRTRYRKHRALLIEEMGGACVQCGSDKELHFDHIDPAQKSFNVGSAFNRSLDFLREELKKCQLLCRSCHEDKTQQELKGRDPWNKNTDSHGTHYMRYTLKCKCSECLKYSEERNAKRRKADSPRPNINPKDGIAHGTRAGYLKERRLGISPCALCQEANNQYGRDLRASKSKDS